MTWPNMRMHAHALPPNQPLLGLLPQPSQMLPPPNQAPLIVQSTLWIALGIALGFNPGDGLLDVLFFRHL
jgi:hypothetical protein